MLQETSHSFLFDTTEAENKAVAASQVVTKTFHGAGIVVPVDKNDVGYRELPETDGKTL